MKRPAVFFGLVGLLVILHAMAAAAGCAGHVSVIAGMPRSSWSWLLGPGFVALQLLVVVVAPILALAGTLETLLLLHRREH
ncbi:MAG: hypothetical protein K0S65_3896 [Labilithrix sp.]|nr:hypothetical protein [Labilithrix sp.]